MTMRATFRVFDATFPVTITGRTPRRIMAQWVVLMEAWRRIDPTVFCVCDPIQR